MDTYSDQVKRHLVDARYWANHAGTGAEYTIRYEYPDAPDEYVTARLWLEAGTWQLGILGAGGRVTLGVRPLEGEVRARLEATLSDMGSYYAINERTIRAFYAPDYPLIED